jgi:hypothetical protein
VKAQEVDPDVRTLARVALWEEQLERRPTAEVRLALRDGVGQLMVQQRQTKALPGSEGHLEVQLGDITRGSVRLTLQTMDGSKLVHAAAARPGDSLRFTWQGEDYWLSVQRLVNLLIGDDYAILTVSVATRGRKSGPVEQQILSLIEIVRSSGITFIRNGERHTAAEAAAHLNDKWRFARDEILTLDDFIDIAAARSWLSGKPYLVELPDGQTIEAADWLREQRGRLPDLDVVGD